jgi:hypothetical protein
MERSPLTDGRSVEQDATPGQPCSDGIEDLGTKMGVPNALNLSDRVVTLPLTIAKAVQFDDRSWLSQPLVVEPPSYSDITQVLRETVPVSSSSIQQSRACEKPEIGIILGEGTFDRICLHSFQPSQRPGGKALDARSMAAVTRSQRIQGLTEPGIISLGHQALDQPDSLPKACDLARGGEAVEHRSTKENAVQVAGNPDSGCRDRAVGLHQQFRAFTVMWLGEKVPGHPVELGIRRDRGVTKSGKEPNQSIRTRAVYTFKDATRTKSKKARRDLGKGVDRVRDAIEGTNLTEPLYESIRMVEVKSGEGGEACLSGQIAPAKGVARKPGCA